MIKQLVIAIFIAYTILTLGMYLFQGHFTYFPDQQFPSLAEFHAQDMQVVSISTNDGLLLYSWYKAAVNHQPTILFLHGNAGHIGNRMSLIREFLRAGYGVLLLEYRGYGGNPGRPNEMGLYEDARAGYRFLQKQGVKPCQIIVYGESLGSAVATRLAEDEPVCSLILQSPLLSLKSVARYHYPWLFISPNEQFDSFSRIKKIKSPLLILHGTADKIVPFSEGLTLYHQANQPKRMLSYSGKTHDDLWTPAFFKDVIRFMQASCSCE